MCGIVASFHWKKALGPSNKWVKEQFSDQLSRGKEGFGMAVFGPNKEVKVFRNTDIAGAFVDFKLEQAPGILFHHRFPTSSPNWECQTHPILVSHKELTSDWYFIHNGIINNDKACREIHEKDGYEYQTSYLEEGRGGKDTQKCNDSEALAVDVVRFIEKKIKTLTVRGSAAWVALEVDKKTQLAKALWFGRNATNPLKIDVDVDEGYIHLSSEGSGESVEQDKAFCFPLDNKKGKITSIPLKVESAYTYTGYGSRRDYLGSDTRVGFKTELDDDWYERELASYDKDNPKPKGSYDKRQNDQIIRNLSDDDDAELAIEALKEHAESLLDQAAETCLDAIATKTPFDELDLRRLQDDTLPGIAAVVKEFKKVVNRTYYKDSFTKRNSQSEVEKLKEALDKDKEGSGKSDHKRKKEKEKKEEDEQEIEEQTRNLFAGTA